MNWRDVEADRYNPLLHRIALLVTALTFPLIFMGGLVTSHKAGMSVPNWPNSYGYNMFTFPISKWVGGIRYEHTHRLAAAAVGLVSIVMVVVAWITDRRKVMRWTAVGIFLTVLSQGALGGLRVVLNERDLAIAHGIGAQLTFCLVAAFAVMTSRFWANPPLLNDPDQRAARRIKRLAAITVGATLCQLLLGVLMRHLDAGLAIPDFPMSFGHWLPPTVLDNSFRIDAIRRYGIEYDFAHVTLFQIWIHFAHRMGALVVSLLTLWVSGSILLRLRHVASIRIHALVLPVLLAGQVTLGILTVLRRKPADIASAHVAVGSLLLVALWVTYLRLRVLAGVQKSTPYTMMAVTQ